MIKTVALVIHLLFSTLAFAQDAQVVFKKVSASIFTVTNLPGKKAGSAVVIQSNQNQPVTWLATNCHVVDSANAVEVRTKNIRFVGSVEYCDSNRDIALIAVKANLSPAKVRGASGSCQLSCRIFVV